MANQNTTSSITDVNLSTLESSDSLPLVISPKKKLDKSKEFCLAWLISHRDWVDHQLSEHGAILIRGFDLKTAEDLQDAVFAFQPSLSDVYRGTSPRNALDGSKYIFSAAEVPNHYPIAQHLEMSFLPDPPTQLFFGCLKPSQQIGGETALCHFGCVAQDLPVELRRKFIAHGIRYTRTHHVKGNPHSFDVSDMLGWPELFGTFDKAKVEEICAEEGTPVEWIDNDTFQSVTHSPAFQRHPVTGEVIWCNHTQVFHWTSFAAELWFSFRRTRDWRLLWTFLLVAVWSVVKFGLLRHKMSLHCEFGNGDEITMADIAAVRKAIHENMVTYRWERGDLLLLDNCSTSHGRQPTFDKNRRIAVAWCNSTWKKTNAIETQKDFYHARCFANPQERTPESTLTKSNAKSLSKALSAELLLQKLEKKKGV